MSKASKSERALRRRREKRARKEANRARYAAMRDAGQNKKSKRFRLRSKRVETVRPHRVKQAAPTSSVMRELKEQVAVAVKASKKLKQLAHKRDLIVRSAVRDEKRAKDAQVWAACGGRLAP